MDDPTTITTENDEYGRYTERNTVELVRTVPVIKEYVIAPYLDPNDPNVRMPGGAMQVVTRPSRWNLQPLTRNGLVVEPQYASVNDDVGLQRLRSSLSRLGRQVDSSRRRAMEAGVGSAANQRRIQQLEEEIRRLRAGR